MKDQLSPRELEVLEYAAQGQTIRQTACVLGIAFSTVRNHRNRIMKKLKAANITHAVTLLREGDCRTD